MTPDERALAIELIAYMVLIVGVAVSAMWDN
jgi:hypothetical protein